MKALSEREYYKQIVSQNLRDKISHYYRFAFLEQIIGTRLLESLDLIKVNPTIILDLGSGTGHDANQLAMRYPKAKIVQLDLSEPMLNASKYLVQPGQSMSCPLQQYLCADAEAIPLQANSVDMIFSNALLPWLPDCEIIFKEVHRILKAEGLFVFSSLGPDTLKECNSILSAMNLRLVQAHTLLIDMHDLGDHLIKEAFESPVMDTTLLNLEYPSPFALLRDLHRTGWSYAMPSMKGFELRQFLKTFKKRYPCHKNENLNTKMYSATLEVIIGHAWRGRKKEQKILKKLETHLL